jgi:hypothetical protein
MQLNAFQNSYLLKRSKEFLHIQERINFPKNVVASSKTLDSRRVI